MKNKVLVIVGPTASGKSDLAVRLAIRFKGEIISADSRQVYRGLNIGTNKITKREMGGITHHLLDVADPKKQFSALDFRNLADKKIEQIIEKKKIPIIVGGTGFYIDVLTRKISLPDAKPSKILRKRLEKYRTEKLFQMIKIKDPTRAHTIDRNNRVRLIRALEIIEALGKVPPPPHRVDTECLQFVYVGLKLEISTLERQIKIRLHKQLSKIIQESKRLHSQGLSYKRMFELGLEYRYVSMYLQNKLTRTELEAKLNTEIRRYAKRQMTWFKRNKNIRWFTQVEYKEIEQYLTKILASNKNPQQLK